MKKSIRIMLLLALVVCILCGCAEPDAPAAPTVQNIFTGPTTVPTAGDPEDQSQLLSPEELEKQQFEKSMKMIRRMSLGFRGGFEGAPGETDWYVYDGGEMEAQLSIKAEGASDIGMGVFIFLDGRPQPYRTEGGEYRYMHTFYPPDGERITEDVYLIPVTGQAGDTLEIVAVCIGWPDYFLDAAPKALQHTGCLTGHGREVRFEADAPGQTLPDASRRVLSWSVGQEEVSGGEIAGWSPEDLRNELESHLYVNGARDSGNVWGYSGAEPLTLRYEIWGGTLGQYGLVLFVDNEPVFLDGEPWFPIQLENGKKTVVEVQVDMSDYDGSSVVYGVLAARNYLADGIGNGAVSFFNNTGTFYICSAESHDDLMGWA